VSPRIPNPLFFLVPLVANQSKSHRKVKKSVQSVQIGANRSKVKQIEANDAELQLQYPPNLFSLSDSVNKDISRTSVVPQSYLVRIEFK